jgi:hypothetical protein
MQADTSVVAITARSDWDSGRWEWEDTPRRDYRDDRPGSQRYHPTRSPMLAAASPDARLVSPWLGGNTPRSTGTARSCVIFTLCFCECKCITSYLGDQTNLPTLVLSMFF